MRKLHFDQLPTRSPSFVSISLGSSNQGIQMEGRVLMYLPFLVKKSLVSGQNWCILSLVCTIIDSGFPSKFCLESTVKTHVRIYDQCTVMIDQILKNHPPTWTNYQKAHLLKCFSCNWLFINCNVTNSQVSNFAQCFPSIMIALKIVITINVDSKKQWEQSFYSLFTHNLIVRLPRA